jgi:MFS family permease
VTAYTVVTAALFSASSSAPTPVYRLYQEIFGISPFVLTLIFATYAFSLLGALLTVGSLSDYVGRRPVIFVALALNAAAMAMFIVAGSTAWLFAARAAQGFATGAGAATLGAAILDSDRSRGPLLNSVTVFLGLTVGVLASGALVAYAPAPTRLIYISLLCASVLLALPLWRLRETAAPKAGALSSLRPYVTVPPQALPAFVRVTPANIATWALGGFYFSLMPSLVAAATGVTSPFIGGLVVALLTFTASLSVVTLRNSPTDRALAIGTIGLASGVAVTLIGAALGLAPLLLLGTIISGVGFGAAFLGTLQAILPLAAADERAGLLSAFYVESYLAFSLPVILGGLSVPALGLLLTTYIYGAIVILLALMSLLATRLSRSGISGGRRRDPDLRSYRLSPMQTSSPAGTTRVESALEQLLQMILHRAMEIAALPAGQRDFHSRRIHESCCDAAKQIGQSADQSADTAQKMTDFARAIVAMIDIGERGRRS